MAWDEKMGGKGGTKEMGWNIWINRMNRLEIKWGGQEVSEESERRGGTGGTRGRREVFGRIS